MTLAQYHRTQRQLSAYLWAVARFAFDRRNHRVFKDMSLERIFRYVAFCHLTHRLTTVFDGGEVKAMAVSWADWHEHIEARAALGQHQFSWTEPHPGDCVFVSEVIGDRKQLAKMWQAMVEAHPHIIGVPIYTYRREKLVRLTLDQIERFC